MGLFSWKSKKSDRSRSSSDPSDRAKQQFAEEKKILDERERRIEREFEEMRLKAQYDEILPPPDDLQIRKRRRAFEERDETATGAEVATEQQAHKKGLLLSFLLLITLIALILFALRLWKP